MIMDDSTIRHLNFKLPSNYRSCFVPMCKNNSKNSPDKVFIVVPRDFKKRKLWFNLARRSDNPTNSHFYCCQDHFILEEDMKNYMRFKLFGAPIKIKLNAVPRFFDCHPDRSRAAKPLQRTAYKKLQHAKEMKEILMEEEHSEGQLRLHDEDSQNSENIYVRRENECNSYSNCSSNVQSSEENVFHELCLSPAEVLTVKNDENIILPSNSSVTSKNKNKAIQVSTIVKNPRKHFRSVGVQCVAKTACKSTETINDANDALNKTLQAEVRKENILPIKNIEQFNAELNTYSSTSISATTGSEYKVLSGESHDVEGWDENLKINSLNMINYFISRDPKRYIGVPEDWMWIIDHLQVITNISTDDIKLTLMKIRLNDTFVRLSNQFGMSATKASHVFNSSVQKLAVLLKQFIFFPEKKSVIRALSIAFRANFSDVQAIIDAFEIQIEKPSDPVHQSLTWSEYKKCNTLKFLISSSPDGFINFISHGYGGRISDTNLFDVCGIMDSLPEGCAVMADRGFKQIDTILAKKNCKLVRPPSVSSHSKLSKTEAIETKRIASLRIHIERVIRRMREFKLLVPHACLNHSIMSYIDSAVTVAAALVNLQPIIIKT